jgi:hypothetical protein
VLDQLVRHVVSFSESGNLSGTIDDFYPLLALKQATVVKCSSRPKLVNCTKYVLPLLPNIFGGLLYQ